MLGFIRIFLEILCCFSESLFLTNGEISTEIQIRVEVKPTCKTEVSTHAHVLFTQQETNIGKVLSRPQRFMNFICQCHIFVFLFLLHHIADFSTR